MNKDGAMTDGNRPISEFEEKIGYKFRNKNLIEVALTHSSYSNEVKTRGEELPFNERLEFLGDSVLSVVVSSYLFEKFKNKQEGDLTKIRAAVVCEKALSKFAAQIELGKYLFLGHGEAMSGGRTRPSITADAFEAVLAAIYLDSDEKFDNVQKFLMPFVEREIEVICGGGAITDYKTKLQQLVQQDSGEILVYVLVSEKGPDHNKMFEVEARLNSNVIGRGQGRSKRDAEQKAAREALVLFGEIDQ